jgi:hypothetical protein
MISIRVSDRRRMHGELTVVKLYGGASVKGTLEWKKGISSWLWYLPAYWHAKQQQDLIRE